MWSATQVPHILQMHGGGDLGHARAQAAGDRPGRRRRVRRQARRSRPRRSSSSLVAPKLGKPVKWTETRSESLLSAHHGRDQIQDITIAAKRDGTDHRAGSRPARRHGRLPRPGRRRACRSSARSCSTRSTSSRPTGSPARTCSPTRRPPTPTAAPAGRRPRSPSSGSWTSSPSSSAWTRWSCASRTGSSTRSSRSPRSCGLTYDSGNYEAATEQGQGAVRLRRAAPRAGGAAATAATRSSSASASRPSPRCAGWRRRGCSARWPTAPAAGSPRRSGCCPPARSRWSPARPAHGQGHETAWSQIVADQLGVPFEDIEVLHGDTQISPKGLDTYGSRSLAVGGIAVVKAAEKVVAKARKIAAHLLEASEDDLEFAGGRFGGQGHRQGRGDPGGRARPTFAAHNLPDGVEPSLDSDATFDPENFSFPHGTHLAAVEVDTETGRVDHPQVRLRRRRRQGGQPADRRGPGARRPRPGHRAGAVRGGQLRRAGHAGQRHVRRLHAALGGRPAQLHHRPHRDPGDDATRWASRASARRARSPRPRRSSTACSTRCATWASPTIEMPCTPQRVWRAIQDGQGPRHPGDAGRHPLAGCRARLDRPEQPPGRGPVIPAPFDYVKPGHGRGGRRGAGRGRRGRQGPRRRAEPAAGAAAAAGGPVGARRPRRDRRSCGASATTATGSSIGAMTPHHEVMRDDLVNEHVALLAQATATVADTQVRHRGTLGGALAHADPAGDLGGAGAGAGRGDGDRRAVRHAAPCRRRSSSSTTSPPRSARTRSSPRSGSRSTPAGAATTRSSTARRRRGRSSRSPRRCGSRAARSPRPGSG